MSEDTNRAGTTLQLLDVVEGPPGLLVGVEVGRKGMGTSVGRYVGLLQIGCNLRRLNQQQSKQMHRGNCS